MYKCQYCSNVQNTIICTSAHKTSAHHPPQPFLTVKVSYTSYDSKRRSYDDRGEEVIDIKKTPLLVMTPLPRGGTSHQSPPDERREEEAIFGRL